MLYHVVSITQYEGLQPHLPVVSCICYVTSSKWCRSPSYILFGTHPYVMRQWSHGRDKSHLVMFVPLLNFDIDSLC